MPENKPKNGVISGFAGQLSFWKRLHIDKRLLGVVILAIAILAGVILINNIKAKPSNYRVTYKASHIYKIAGSQDGRGVVFNKPDAYNGPIPSEDTPTFVGFAQLNSDSKTKKNTFIAGRLLVKSNDYPKGPSAGLVKLINQSMSAPASDSGYQGVVRNAQNFARTAFLQPGVQIDFGHAGSFTSNFVKSNAWSFDVDVTQPKGDLAEQKGELLFIIGNKTAYYFFVSALRANWDSNGQFFQGILDSVKIDQ